MSKISTVCMAIVACLVIGVTGIFYGYSVFNKDNNKIKVEEEKANFNQLVENNALQPSYSNENKTLTQIEPKIKSDTKIVYEYYYLGNGEVETSTENAPYFLIDLTEPELKSAVLDWQVISFAEDEVTLRKNVSGTGKLQYILGVENGYIAVFYDEPESGVSLKEVTNTPISSLSIDEQIRLKEGIIITDEERLVKTLEDFGC